MVQVQILSKILETKDYSIIEDNLLDVSYFTGYEAEYEYIRDHYEKYKNVPDELTFKERFEDFDLVEVSESDKYLVDKIREEKLYNESVPILEKAAELYKEDANKAVEFIASNLKNIQPNYNIGGTDIIKTANTRYDNYIDRSKNQDKYYFSTGFKELDELTHGIQRGEELLVIFARINQGKCLGKGTEILMADGSLKKVEDIKIGDRVQSLDSINTVEYVHNGVSNGYKVIPKIGEPFIISSEHILTLKVLREEYVHDANGRRMETKGNYDLIDIQVEDFLKWSEHKRNLARLYRPAIEYTTKEQAVPPYIIGTWLGDGISREVTLTSVDKEIIDEWENYAISCGLKLVKRTNDIAYAIVNRKGIPNPVKELFKNMNLLNNKHIPLNYLTGDYNQRMELLAGILDTDGSYSKINNVFEISFKSKILIEQTAQLCRGLGFKVGKIQVKHNKQFNKDYYRFTFSGELYKIPNRLSRKQANPTTPKQVESLTGFEIIPLDKVEYYGFQTNGDHRFLLWDNTLTHNTWVAQKMATSVWEQGYNVGYFSPEMTAESIGYRFDTLHKNFSNKQLMWGNSTDDKAYKDYVNELATKKNKLVVTTLMDFNRKVTVSKLRNWIKQEQLDMIVIDGITYLTDERYKRGDNKTTSITNISEDLMSLSVEMEIPIIAVVQANRNGVQEEEDKVPELEHIRDSDGLGMNASKVLSIKQKYGILEIGIKKQRQGRVGDILKYTWDIDKGQFTWIPTETNNISKETVEQAIQDQREQFNDLEEVF